MRGVIRGVDDFGHGCAWNNYECGGNWFWEKANRSAYGRL